MRRRGEGAAVAAGPDRHGVATPQLLRPPRRFIGIWVLKGNPIVCCRGEVLPSPQDLIDTVRDLVASTGLTLILEPGRSMVATSSALVNTVRLLFPSW